MPENYPEQLAARLRAQNTAGRSLNKPTFFAAKADVVAALDAGFLPKDIWSDLRARGRIDFSYDTFLRMVKQYISSPDTATPNVPSEKRTATNDKPGLPLASLNRPAAPSGNPGFVFNPVPNKDKLI